MSKIWWLFFWILDIPNDMNVLIYCNVILPISCIVVGILKKFSLDLPLKNLLFQYFLSLSVYNFIEWRNEQTKRVEDDCLANVVKREPQNIFDSLKKKTWRNATVCQNDGFFLLLILCSMCSKRMKLWLVDCLSELNVFGRYLAKRKLIKLILFISYSVFYILFCSQLFITIDVDHNKLNARNRTWLAGGDGARDS